MSATFQNKKIADAVSGPQGCPTRKLVREKPILHSLVSHLYKNLTTLNDKNRVSSVNNHPSASQKFRHNGKINGGENWEDGKGWKRRNAKKESRNSHWHTTSPTTRLNRCQCNNTRTVTGLYFSYSACFLCLKDTAPIARSTVRGKTCSEYHAP